jgi:glyoxylase-like metal-dependent hydrolase (beta-lactamase superfamily II)
MAIGDFELTVLLDGHDSLAPELLHGMSGSDMQRQLHQAFLPAKGPIHTAVNAFLVHTGQRLMLIDAGAATCFGPALGNVRNNLHSAGYRPEDIDTILLTHMHGDHVCGLADKGEAVFPGATVWVAKDEADYWLDEKNAAQAPEGLRIFYKLARDSLAPYMASGRFKTYSAGEILSSGVTPMPNPGHTPGHHGYLLTSQGQSLFVWGDIVHSHAVQFEHPEVSIEFDSDRKQAIATREKVFADVAKTRVLVAGMHLPFPGLGHVARERLGYRWVPVEFGQRFVETE